MRTEREKMIAGELYNASDADLVRARIVARERLLALNELRAGASIEERMKCLRELFGTVGEGTWIEPPFFCDYGDNIALGDRVYFNFNCVVLDPAPVTIGNDVFFGPNVQIYTATHPLDYRERRSGLESARSICIDSDVWIGGGTILCPGVRVGAQSVIGAGSVVTKDIPQGVVAVGNPCRVVRPL